MQNKLNRNVEEILHDLAVRSGVEEKSKFCRDFWFCKKEGETSLRLSDNSTHISAKIEVERKWIQSLLKEAGGEDYECDAILFSPI